MENDRVQKSERDCQVGCPAVKPEEIEAAMGPFLQRAEADGNQQTDTDVDSDRAKRYQSRVGREFNRVHAGWLDA